MSHHVIDSQAALAALLTEVRQEMEAKVAIISEAIDLLESALIQGSVDGDDAVGAKPDSSGWLDTGAISTWHNIGDWLVQYAGWERHPNGRGRRQFYRPPQEPEPDS